jgi:hypothetical protein
MPPTPTHTPSSTPPPAKSAPLSDVKVTLDNLSAWDAAFAENKGEDPQPDPEEAEATPTEEESEKEAQESPQESEAGKTGEEEQEQDHPDAGTGEDEAEGKKKGGRDLSPFAEEDQPFLKQMSRQAFDHISKKLLGYEATLKEKEALLVQAQEDKTNGKTLPDAWYNDPAAAEASPEFKTVKTEFEQAQQQTHQYGSLLDQYESGALKFNPATGTLIPNDDETPVDPRVVRQLSDARMAAFEKQKELAARGNAITENFGRIYKQSEEKVAQSALKLFPWLTDAKHANQQPLAQVHAEWPKTFQAHPVARFASALAVEHIKLKMAYAELEKKVKSRESLKTVRKQTGPISGRNGRVGSESSDRKLTLDDFP